MPVGATGLDLADSLPVMTVQVDTVGGQEARTRRGQGQGHRAASGELIPDTSFRTTQA